MKMKLRTKRKIVRWICFFIRSEWLKRYFRDRGLLGPYISTVGVGQKYATLADWEDAVGAEEEPDQWAECHLADLEAEAPGQAKKKEEQT